MARLVNVVVPETPPKPRKRLPSPKSSLTIDLATAKLVRQAQRAERVDLTTLVDGMLQAYIRRAHPEWKTVVAGQPAGAGRRSRRPG